MAADACVAFLKGVTPKLGLAWQGFRKVHAQVCKRVRRRFLDLGLADFAAYRAYLDARPAEWELLEGLCNITISRFWRDRATFDRLAEDVVPRLADAAIARGDTVFRAWSAGCASGEEPYSLKLLWEHRVAPTRPGLVLAVIATDSDPTTLRRARDAAYRPSSLRELPTSWIESAFDREGRTYRLRDELRAGIEFRQEDIRTRMPEGPFDLVLCRNLVFTYFDRASQEAVLDRIVTVMRPSAALVVGRKERLPKCDTSLAPWFADLGIYRRRTPP